MSNNNYIIHYASPYYDPVKAHEYYMRNRELKGRKSTAGLNDAGKEAAKYVKEQLTTERKGKVETHKNKTDNQIESLRNQKTSTVEARREEMQGKIDQLKEKLSSMTPKQKEANRERINSIIGSLREKNKQERLRLQENFKSSSSSLREDHKQEKTNLKAEYDQKYIDELDKIRSDKRFIKVSKRKKS